MRAREARQGYTQPPLLLPAHKQLLNQRSTAVSRQDCDAESFQSDMQGCGRANDSARCLDFHNIQNKLKMQRVTRRPSFMLGRLVPHAFLIFANNKDVGHTSTRARAPPKFRRARLRRGGESFLFKKKENAGRARRPTMAKRPDGINRAHGVVVSHPLSMREALGSIPSVSMLKAAAAIPNQK